MSRLRGAQHSRPAADHAARPRPTTAGPSPSSSLSSVHTATEVHRAAAPVSAGCRSLPSGGLHLDIPKAAGRGPVTDVHRLHGLALAAVHHSPQPPLVMTRNRVAGAPELGGDAAVDGVAHQPHAAAVADLPAVLTAELEVEA